MSKILDYFVSLVTSRPHRAARGFININCPACADTRKRGGFALTDTGGFRYSCFNGGCPYNIRPTGWEPGNTIFSGRVRELLDILGGDIRQLPMSELVNQGNRPKRTRSDIIVTKFPERRMPKGTMLLEDGIDRYKDADDVMAYLDKRSPLYMDSGFPFMWSSTMPRHLLIPFIHTNDTIVGYMGRNIDVTTGKNRFKQTVGKEYMFGQHHIFERNDKILFVVESPMDAILIQGIGVRANKFTEKQCNILNKSQRRIVLVPDRKKGEMRPFLEVAKKYSWEVSIPRWKYKDVGESITDVGLLITINSLISAISGNHDKMMVLEQFC